MEKDYICANCGKEYEVDLCFCNRCIQPKVVSKKALATITGVKLENIMSLFDKEKEN